LNGSKLYERLRKEARFYCLGKKPSILKITCEYIEARIEGRKLTQHDLSLKYNSPIMRNRFWGRVKEIVKLLKLEEEADWKWKT